MASRGFVVTAIAAAVLSSTAYAQTNSSSGINRKSATEAAQSGATTPTATTAKTTAAQRATAAKKSTAKTAKTKRARRSTATAIRPVKITIHGDRTDARMARQQGMQSLQNANAAVAERNAAAQAATDDNAAAAANESDAANAQNNYNNYLAPYYGYNAGYGFSNVPYGSSPTVSPFLVGPTPLGSPVVNFPPFYNTYSPGVFSTYTTSPFGSTFGMYSY